MKVQRKPALILAVSMILTAVLPMQGFALDAGEPGVEKPSVIAAQADESGIPEDAEGFLTEDAAGSEREEAHGTEPLVSEAEQETGEQLSLMADQGSNCLQLSGGTSEPVVSFQYDKTSYTYPDPVMITAMIDDTAATPTDVTWYQLNSVGDAYNVISGKNPLVLPVTVPSSNPMWFARIKDVGVKNTKINIKEPVKGMVVVFDNQPVYPGETVAATSSGGSGSVSLSEDRLTAIISNVNIPTCTDATDIFAKLMIYGVTEDEYHLVFEGDSDFGYNEPPSEEVYLSIIGGFYSGSRVEIKSATPGTPINLKGTGFDFFETGYPEETREKITNFTIKDINLTAYAWSKLPICIYSTQLECSNCNISAKAVDYPGAIEIGLNNLEHPEGKEYSKFTNCTIDAETDYAQLGDPDVEGAPSPSAFNCSHNHVLLKNCTTNLKLDHTTLGECRGVYMLSGELTIDGGTLDIDVECPLGDLDDRMKTDSQVLAAAIQAVSFSAKNNAQVNATVSNAPHSAWGIIYADDVTINDSSLDIDVLHTYENISKDIDSYGYCTQGIYYYGDDRIPGDIDIWEETDILNNQAYTGNVVISSGSNVDIYLEGTPYEYTTCGISGRYLSVDDSDVSVEVQTHPFADSELYPGFGAAFVIYDFADDADIELKDAAITSPSETRIQTVERESIPKTSFYTVLDENTKDIVKHVKIEKGVSPAYKYTNASTGGTGDGTISPTGSVYTGPNVFIDFTATPDAHSRILYWVVDGVETAYGQNNYQLAVGTDNHTVQVVFEYVPEIHHSSGEYFLFTGSTGNPVTNGNWKMNADGTWSFATSRAFTNTWGFIRYMANGVPVDSWFWFDKNGKMLTGWQKLYWNGKLSWFYFKEIHDGTFGACQLGGKTPDGYTLNADGSWTGYVAKLPD